MNSLSLVNSENETINKVAQIFAEIEHTLRTGPNNSDLRSYIRMTVANIIPDNMRREVYNECTLPSNNVNSVKLILREGDQGYCLKFRAHPSIHAVLSDKDYYLSIGLYTSNRKYRTSNQQTSLGTTSLITTFRNICSRAVFSSSSEFFVDEDTENPLLQTNSYKTTYSNTKGTHDEYTTHSLFIKSKPYLHIHHKDRKVSFISPKLKVGKIVLTTVTIKKLTDPIILRQIPDDPSSLLDMAY